MPPKKGARAATVQENGEGSLGRMGCRFLTDLSFGLTGLADLLELQLPQAPGVRKDQLAGTPVDQRALLYKIDLTCAVTLFSDPCPRQCGGQ